MGITGLLPFIKNSCRSANLKDFSGATVAIDAYSWLHKGAFSCAEKLVKGEKTDGYIFYCAKLLNMLLEIGVKPIMVFDGCNLQSKEVTEKKRRENREKTKQRGKELLCEGKLKEARECFQRCVDVTPEMAREVIEMCRKKSVDCVVAPYEADAELAYLNKAGIADIIITEDSDLILFGCNKILFKMDNFGGGLLYEKENLPKSFGANASKFSFEKFRYICILSGCDYLPSLPGIGLAKACKFFMLTTNSDLSSVLKKLPSYLKMPKLEVTDEYIDSFIKANNTFLYQLVFCPLKKCLVPLNSYPDDVNASDMEYAGKYLPDDLAIELAIGNINVKTLKKFENSECGDSFSDIKKDVVWGSISKAPENKHTIKKVETAFKFNSQKSRAVKRKVESIDDDNDLPVPQNSTADEELFAMYRNLSSNTEPDDLEEDPLVVVPEKKPKLSSLFSPENSTVYSPNASPKNPSTLKRVVRSRFFAPKVETIDSSIPVLRENSPEKVSKTEDSIVTADIEISLENSENEGIKLEIESPSSIKSNKENIAHRFAKRAITAKPSNTLSSADITSSLTKVERSWLDIIDTECSANTSTISSGGLAIKSISLDGDTSSEKNNTPRNNFVKIKKTKLISTKILDFKWDKSTKNKFNSEKSTDKSPVTCSSEKNDCDIECILDSSNAEVSPAFNCENFRKNTSCDTIDNEVFDQDIDNMSLPSSSAKSSSSETSYNSQPSSSSETVIRPLDLKQFSVKSTNKPGKCRSIGLSKNRKSSEKKGAIQETLMNFSFTKKPKNEFSFST